MSALDVSVLHFSYLHNRLKDLLLQIDGLLLDLRTAMLSLDEMQDLHNDLKGRDLPSPEAFQALDQARHVRDLLKSSIQHSEIDLNARREDLERCIDAMHAQYTSEEPIEAIERQHGVPDIGHELDW
ncbi:MAG: hypothetical protein MMC23_008591 [Stictis urceolatum]|nr:hypothetical protein [Stictis urceolata]